MLSILVSTYGQLPKWRRSLFSIACHPPSIPYEVVVCDEESDDSIFIFGELRLFSSTFPWTFIQTQSETYNKKHNQDLAREHSKGDLIAIQGNDIIAYGSVYNELLADIPPDNTNFIVYSTTYNIPEFSLSQLDVYGANLRPQLVDELQRFPLQTSAYQSLVEDYLSISPRKKGDNSTEIFSEGISLCQAHNEIVRRPTLSVGAYTIKGVFTNVR